MITKLVEGDKVKAHQYWPDEDKPMSRLENDIKVRLDMEDREDGINTRTLLVSNKGEIVSQLQTIR